MRFLGRRFKNDISFGRSFLRQIREWDKERERDFLCNWRRTTGGLERLGFWDHFFRCQTLGYCFLNPNTVVLLLVMMHNDQYDITSVVFLSKNKWPKYNHEEIKSKKPTTNWKTFYKITGLLCFSVIRSWKIEE
jgi:hypothetical protein